MGRIGEPKWDGMGPIDIWAQMGRAQTGWAESGGHLNLRTVDAVQIPTHKRLGFWTFCLEPQQFHPTSNVNASDRSFYLANKAIEVSRVDDSLGIDLFEV